MRSSRFLVLLTLVVFLTAALPVPARAASLKNDPPPTSEVQSQLAPLVSDSFGYQGVSQAIQAAAYPGNPNLPVWIPDTIGVVRPVTFSQYLFWDNAISDPITIGENQSTPGLMREKPTQQNPNPVRLPFRFYGENYTTLYVSINGLVRFENENSDNRNYPLPTGDLTPSAPTNFIAAAWADLDANHQLEYDYDNTRPETRVYVQYLPHTLPFLGSINAFVITWLNVFRRNTNDYFNFQVVLMETGDIYVNLQDIPNPPGNLTIGIEDPTGEDGLMVYYNDGAVPSLDAWSFGFIRPDPDFWVSLSPKLQGRLTASGKADFKITVKNITESDPLFAQDDLYELSVSSPLNGWSVQFYDGNYKLLKDTQGSFAGPDTSWIHQGDSKTVNVRVTAPPNAQPGDNNILVIRALSWQSGGLYREVKLQVAVPTAFASAYADSTGTYLGLTWRINQSFTRLFGFSGDELAVENTQAGFVYAWSEYDLLLGKNKVHFAFLDRLGFVTKSSLISNPTESDSAPALAVDSNTGNIVLAWVRQITLTESQIWYAVLNANDPDGIVKYPAILSGSSGLSVSSPTAAFRTGAGNFSVAWVAETIPGGNKQIQTCVVGLSGSPSCNANVLSTTALVYGLTFEGLPGTSDTVLFYVDTIDGNPRLRYKRMSGTGVVTTGLLSSSVSLNQLTTSAARVKNDRLLVTWLDPAVSTGAGSWAVQGVSYIVLDANLNQVGSKSLYAPNLTNADYISVASDKDGRAVLSWTDADTYRYVYYALVEPTTPASPVTPAMLIKTLPSGALINLSRNGQGLAAYDGRFETSLPFIRK